MFIQDNAKYFSYDGYGLGNKILPSNLDLKDAQVREVATVVSKHVPGRKLGDYRGYEVRMLEVLPQGVTKTTAFSVGTLQIRKDGKLVKALPLAGDRDPLQVAKDEIDSIDPPQVLPTREAAPIKPPGLSTTAKMVGVASIGLLAFTLAR